MEAGARTRRLTAVRREEARVTALELFFDLVFVLAVTQCTTLMANDADLAGASPRPAGARGLLVALDRLRVADERRRPRGGRRPDRDVRRDGGVPRRRRSRCPNAFGDDAFAFACAYGVVRLAHIGLFVIASRDAPALRRSVTGLGASTAIGVALLLAASSVDGWMQGALWVVALVVDVGAPLLFWSEGWQLMPAHFAERFGLIVIIALGESIVAIGVGSHEVVDLGVVTAATLGDRDRRRALVAVLRRGRVARRAAARRGGARPRAERARARRLRRTPLPDRGRDRARWRSASRRRSRRVGDALDPVPAVALARRHRLYLLGHVAFRWRLVHTLEPPRLLCAVVAGRAVPACAGDPGARDASRSSCSCSWRSSSTR